MSIGEKPHSGHRSRLRERFIKEGLDSFEEHNILELLLFYVIPQKDTNELAHALLDRFGTLEGVLRADTKQLTEVNGVGERTAEYLAQLAGMVDTFLLAEKEETILEGSDNTIAYALSKLSFSTSELLAVFLIDNKHTLLSWHVLQNKAVHPDKIDNRLLLSLIIDTNATHVILVHKYAGKKAIPKRRDNCIAYQINNLLMTVGVRMANYIIIGSDNTVQRILDK